MKKSLSFAVISIFMMILFTGCNGGEQAASDKVAAETLTLSEGQQIFMNNCAGCHGNGDNPPNPEEKVMASSKLQSLETFTQWVRRPSTTMMPPFSEEKLPAEEVGQLYEYINGLMSVE